MRPPSLSLLRGLALTAAATLVAGLVSAFTVGTSSGSSHATSSASGGSHATSSASTLAPGSTAVETTPGGVSTTVAASATTVTTAAPLPPAAGPVGDPGQPTATTPGTYMFSYTYSGRGSDPPTSGDLAEKVTTTASAAGVTRQSVVDNGPDANAARNRTVEWRPSGLYEIQEVLNFNGQSATCTWTPPVLEAPVGLAIGKTWTLTGSCQMSLYGQPVSLHLSGSAKVTGKQRVMVGRDAVNVWLTSASYTATATNPAFGTFTIHSDTVDKLAARLGLTVEEDATTTGSSANSAPRTVHIHLAAKSIHPS
ncbi:MAG: hypothetical protein ACYDH6_16450 [Acidimicrobiales bacterium]